jgi:GMP synthase-like glutamine amidotransferase
LLTVKVRSRSTVRPVAIARFSPTEGPGYFADWLDARGIGWELVAIDQGARVPADPREYAGIGLMGGPMSANDALPWIAPVLQLLRDAVAADVPVIGHCLGGQLLAKALGGEVRRADATEIGWIDADVVAGDGAADWFGGRSRLETFQWHYEAFSLPPGAARVLTNRHNVNQAYVVDERHIGLQCHVEMTGALVSSWIETGARELPKVSTATLQSAADMTRDLPAHLALLNAVAADVYTRWARGLRS